MVGTLYREVRDYRIDVALRFWNEFVAVTLWLIAGSLASCKTYKDTNGGYNCQSVSRGPEPRANYRK